MRLLVLAMLCALATRAHADDGDRWSGGTMALQAGGGALGMFIGGVLGGAIGGAATKNDHEGWGQLSGESDGLAIGGMTGVIVGVDLVGNARGSTGHWYGALGGGLAGGAMVMGLLHFQPTSSTAQNALIVTAIVLLVAAPVVGYQLTADAHAHPSAVPLALFTF